MKKIFTATFALLLTALSLHAQTPKAYDVAIQGLQNLSHVLTGIYSYSDSLGRPEGNSMYRWYRADSLTQTQLVPIDSAWTIAYVTDTIADANKYVIFEVTPVASGTGDSLVGEPVRAWTTRLFWVGIEEKNPVAVTVFPNPAESRISFITDQEITSVSIFTAEGRKISETLIPGEKQMNVSSLPSGLYLLKIGFRNGGTGFSRLIRR